MQKHLVLLKQLSRADEYSNTVTFNSLAMKTACVAAPLSADTCNSQINVNTVKGKSIFWKDCSQSNLGKESKSFFFTDHDVIGT